ncbi:MAG: hypothetical protein ETSY1_11220 [Candidatus Entotheonella factor]|uniref:Tyrosinase copper-binding domain-containing protein n=1 Tax=Entotheonella factor TaxID=1429438 RepID=W4LRD4_ENTF1|nr:MAG: hypothetical protein ETSY1_11220 [Candidatus Entotheonella factor]
MNIGTSIKQSAGFSLFGVGVIVFVLACLLSAPTVVLAQEDRVEIQVRQTASPDDDYLTWAPTRARVRVRPGASTSDLKVVLTNETDFTMAQRYDQRPYQKHGSVLFDGRDTLPWGETVQQPSLELTLPQTEAWVNFWVAGEFKHPSIGKKDAVIVAHQEQRDGPIIGRLEVMVRIRKNILALEEVEKEDLLEAISDLHNKLDAYIPLVQIHSWTKWGMRRGVNQYPDQGHQFPGFLPWHRIYLLDFERQLQAINPAVTLAYWVQSEDLDGDHSILTTDFLGKTTVPATPPDKVNCLAAGTTEFDTDNPLFGWKMPSESWWRNPDNPCDPSDTACNPDGFQELQRGDSLCSIRDLGFPWLSTEELLAKSDYTSFSSGEEGIENNPHNVGHGLLAINRDGWMGDAKSPRDPIFMLFHSYFDMVWAKWQWQHGRFYQGDDTSDAKVYCPNDAFGTTTTSTCTTGPTDPRGHHLLDTMWPWNGLSGPTSPHCRSWTGCRDRHPPVVKAKFPRSRWSEIWPGDEEATPTPKDAIDYLGMNEGVFDMGFAYDDVPYGIAPAEAPDEERVAEAPRRALRRAAQPRAEALNRMNAILADSQIADPVRIQALNLSSQGTRKRALSEAIRILKDPEDGDTDLDVHAIRTLQALSMRVEGIERMEDIREAVRSALKDPRQPVRQAAIHFLGGRLDPAAIETLKEDLDNHTNPLFTKQEVLRLLSFAGRDHVELMRPFLKHEDPKVRQAAIRALAADPHSYKLILEVMSNENAETSLRNTAIRVLMSTREMGFIDTALDILDDASAELDVQKHALAGLGFFVRANVDELSKEKLKIILDRLFDLSPNQVIALSRTLVRALELTYEALAEKG